MKILLLSPWTNAWNVYFKKYFEGRGHQFDIVNKLILQDLPKYDTVISAWADVFAQTLGEFPKLAKKYLCFLRSYEYYTNIDTLIKPDNFDNFIFTNQYLLDNSKLPRKVLIPNAIDLERIPFEAKTKGRNILFLGDINFKKGVEVLIQIAYKYPEHHFFGGDNEDLLTLHEAEQYVYRVIL